MTHYIYVIIILYTNVLQTDQAFITHNINVTQLISNS